MVRRLKLILVLPAMVLLIPIQGLAQSPDQERKFSHISFPARIEVPGREEPTNSAKSYWKRDRGIIETVQQTDSPNEPGVQQDESAIIRDAIKEAIGDLTADQQRAIKETLYDWPRRSLGEIPIDPRDLNSQVPKDRATPLIERFDRNWSAFASSEKIYQWQAPNIAYNPLYFEDVALERYGQTPDDYWQTAISGAHFFTSACLLPCHMIKDPIWSCDYPLGYCRPGDCTGRIWQRQFWVLQHWKSGH